MATVVALRNLVTSFRDIGNRSKGERFPCPDWLAAELQAAGEVRIEGAYVDPKAERALPAGLNGQRLSLPQGQASSTHRSRK